MKKQFLGYFTSLLMMTNFTMADNNHKAQLTVIPKQVVVFDLGALDTLDQLGVVVKAVPKQNLPVYLTNYRADNYADVGGLKTPNIEKVKTLQPDLIIISGRQQGHEKELAVIAPTINVTTDVKQYETSFKNNMQRLATVFAKQTELNKALTALDKQAAIIQQQATQSASKALILVHYNGKFIASESSNYVGLIHSWLGVNLVSLATAKKEVNNPRILLTDKEIATLNPDIIFIIDRNEAIGEGKMDRKVVADSAIKQTKAYQTKKVIYLTPDLWYLSGNGLESVKLQMAEVATVFK